MAIVTSCEDGHLHVECQHGITGLAPTGFCTRTILLNSLLEVPDATWDQHFRKLSEVREAPFIRSYVGVPPISPAGKRLGTFALLNTRAQTIDPVGREHIRILGASGDGSA